MRYLTWKEKQEMVGLKRTRTGFLWLPKGGRWLETATWEDVYSYHGCCGFCGGGDSFSWDFDHFLDLTKKEK